MKKARSNRIRIHRLGLSVFSSKEDYKTWLGQISISLGGVKPKDLLDTSDGHELVYDEILKIDHGVFG